MIITKQLGMIPSWQSNAAWVQNPNFNNHVSFPPGWDQLTIQPVGSNYAPPPEAGLGRGVSIYDDCCGNGHPECCQAAARMRARGSLRGLGAGLGMPRSLVVGGLGLLALAGLAGVALLLK